MRLQGAGSPLAQGQARAAVRGRARTWLTHARMVSGDQSSRRSPSHHL